MVLQGPNIPTVGMTVACGLLLLATLLLPAEEKRRPSPTKPSPPEPRPPAPARPPAAPVARAPSKADRPGPTGVPAEAKSAWEVYRGSDGARGVGAMFGVTLGPR